MKLKRTLVLLVMAVSGMVVFAQSTDPGFAVWNTLAKVEFYTTVDPSGTYEIEMPIFSRDVKELSGQEVIIRGYVIPTEHIGDQQYFVLSKLPYESCFYCGKAGIETIIEVYAKNYVPYQMDKAVSFKGKLEVNEDDWEHLIYLLKDAEVYRP